MSAAPSPSALVPAVIVLVKILVVVDLLFGFSLGLLIGRGIGVARAHRYLPREDRTPPAPPAPPLPGA